MRGYLTSLLSLDSKKIPISRENIMVLNGAMELSKNLRIEGLQNEVSGENEELTLMPVNSYDTGYDADDSLPVFFFSDDDDIEEDDYEDEEDDYEDEDDLDDEDEDEEDDDYEDDDDYEEDDDDYEEDDDDWDDED